ncbi:MAG: YhgE/Pip family protein [Collinsella aerofaciens]
MLREQNEKLQSIKDGLSAQSSAMANDAAAVSGASDAINNAIQAGATNLGQAQTDLGQNALPKASSALDSFAAVSGDLTGIVSGMTPTLANARGTLATQRHARSGQDHAVPDRCLACQGPDKLATAANDIAALQTSESMGELADLMDDDVKDVADFMAYPVELTSKSIYPVKSFGSGIAPFYTNLALWVGGYVLIAIYKLEVDREGIGSFTARQGYFGRWLLMVILGAFQAIIVTVGDLVIGVQCVNPLLFVLGGVAISFTYVNIIYALSTTFKHIGKAIGVILVIVQIPGSSGMYPIEMMPGFFQWLHPLLPFTYGINLLRETVGGMYSFNYLFNLCILVVFLIVALFIGLQLRPLLLNLNLLFDKQLSTTGLMICESNDLPRQRYSLRTAMRVMLDSDSYRRELLDHAVAFEHRYPYYIKGGFAAVVGVQVLLFALSTVLDIDNNGKIILLVIWIISVIVICGWLINIEYIRASLNTQMRISALSDEDLRREMREHTAAIPAARRMFGLNASERGSKSKDQAVDQSIHHDMHHVSANGDDTFVMNEDGVPLGKHSKGGET